MTHMTVINAKNLILGRLASSVAKRALLGESIELVNCEQAVITGNKKWLIARYRQRRERGTPTQGPFFPRQPERFVKRTIRGMLPYKKELGRAALGNPWFFAEDDPLRRFSPFFQSEDYAHKHDGEAFESQAIEITPELVRRRLDTLARHIQLFAELLPHKSFATMKKHFKAYVSGWEGAKALRFALMECQDAAEALAVLSLQSRTL